MLVSVNPLIKIGSDPSTVEPWERANYILQVANQPPDWYWWIWLPVIWLPWCKRPPNSASTEAKFVADRASITRGILRSGLGMRCWHASDKDHSFFIQVYAPSEAFLRNVAKEMKLSLELDRLELRRRDIIANAEASGKSITREELDVIVNEERDHELAIHRTKKYSGLLVGHNPYQYIYTPFNPEERIVKLFGIRDRAYNSPFDNMRVLQMIIWVLENEKGAGLDLDRLWAEGILLNCFPGHQAGSQDRLQVQAWRKWYAYLDIHLIRNYFGEQVGFYFSLQRFLMVIMLLHTVIGAVMFFVQQGASEHKSLVTPVYGLVVAITTAFMWEFWKRHESSLAMMWGMSDFHSREALRPQFVTLHAKDGRSPVTGGADKTFSRDQQRIRACISITTSALLIGMLVGITVGMVRLRVFLQGMWGVAGTTVAAVINSVQIQITGIIYRFIAIMLTDYECPPTLSAYTNSLVAKRAVLAFINNYFILFYIAFLKSSGLLEESCAHIGTTDRCIDQLRFQVLSNMVTALILGNVLEVGWPYIQCVINAVMACLYRAPTTLTPAEIAERRAKAPRPELQAAEEEFSVLENYLELFSLFGYCMLFVPAFPLAPVIGLISLVVEHMVDLYKVLHDRRPRPVSSQGVGVWLSAFQAMSFLAIMTNLGVVLFTTRTEIFGSDDRDRARVFLVSEHIVLFIVIVAKLSYPDVSDRTHLQLQRQDHLIRRHVLGLRDDTFEPFEATPTRTGFCAWVYQAMCGLPAAPIAPTAADAIAKEARDRRAPPTIGEVPVAATFEESSTQCTALAETSFATMPLSSPRRRSAVPALSSWDSTGVADEGGAASPAAGTVPEEDNRTAKSRMPRPVAGAEAVAPRSSLVSASAAAP